MMLQARQRKQAAKISSMIYSIEIILSKTICLEEIWGTFFCGSCRCWLQKMVMKLVSGGWAVGVKFWTFTGAGVTKIVEMQTKGEGGPNFGDFAIT